ncbi:hypothetical protein [Ralstonia pickettii]|mgnify:CR=1 FL=1|nr:hypothetical protein [Ralstonia pickettii]
MSSFGANNEANRDGNRVADWIAFALLAFEILAFVINLTHSFK